MLRSSLKSLALTLLCVAGMQSTHAVAQDDTPAASDGVMKIQMAVEDDGSGAGPIVISSSTMSFASDGADGESNFQFFTGSEITSDWMPSGSGKLDPLSLLNNEDVRAELELVGDQLDKFENAQKELQEKIAEKAKSLASGKIDPAQMGEIAKQIAELRQSRQQKLESMLLPHQLERLKQVALQVQMKKRGAANTLISKEMAEELGIDAAQKKRIEDRQKELKKELADRMAKLKEEMKNKLLAELTSEQKSKLEELSGDSFDYKPTNINDQIQKRIKQRMEQRNGG